jgi:hypothetical protein
MAGRVAQSVGLGFNPQYCQENSMEIFVKQQLASFFLLFLKSHVKHWPGTNSEELELRTFEQQSVFLKGKHIFTQILRAVGYVFSSSEDIVWLSEMRNSPPYANVSFLPKENVIQTSPRSYPPVSYEWGHTLFIYLTYSYLGLAMSYFKCIKINQHLAKMPRIQNGERTVSSKNGIEKTG